MTKLNPFNLLNSFLIFSIFALAITPGFSEEEIPKILVKLNAQKVEINNKSYFAVNFQNEKHWHTYWKNPGDACLPIKIDLGKSTQNFSALECLRQRGILSREMPGPMAMKMNTLFFTNLKKN